MKTTRKLGSSVPVPAVPKKKTAPDKKTGTKKDKTSAVEKYTLPTEPTKAVNRLSDCILHIYGDPGIGKTSLSARFAKSFFAMFEPGNKGQTVYERQVNDWEAFRAYVDLICKTDRFSNVVVDTSDKAYERAMEWKCEELGINDPSEGKFGDAWKAVRREFESQFEKLAYAGKGIIFLSHATTREFQARYSTYDKIVPDTSKQCAKTLARLVDVTGFYTYIGQKHTLIIRGSDEWEAKCRLEERFRTTDGKPIVSIPMGESADEAYANLINAFNNKQKKTGAIEVSPMLSNTPVKQKRR